MIGSSSAGIEVSAPVRLDFAGGWTDVAPFAMRERGVVVNAAIELRTRVRVTGLPEGYSLTSTDLQQQVEAPRTDQLYADGRLELHKAAIRRYRPDPCAIVSRAAAPPGSGLGSSGALGVALVHALDLVAGRHRSPIETAEEAWRLETVDADIAGGKQDQCAAALGGFQLLAFERGAIRAAPIRLDPRFADELAARTLLCYTGQSRFSGDTISRVMQAYDAGDVTVASALRAMADIAVGMATALAAGSLTEIAALLDANWREQQRLDPGMCTRRMTELGQAIKRSTGAGGKAAGAGAGGSMFFVVPGKIDRARAAAMRGGVRVIPVRWAGSGVRIG